MKTLKAIVLASAIIISSSIVSCTTYNPNQNFYQQHNEEKYNATSNIKTSSEREYSSILSKMLVGL